MPSKSKAQANLMAMVANNPKAAKRLGISQSVGQEFMKADKRKVKKFDEGGETKFASQFKPGRTDEGATVVKKSSGSARTTTDEERYGKIGAQIRRLDPEAFKNRTDRSAAANLKLLRELRDKKAGAPAKVVETKTETKVEAPRAAAAPKTDTPARRGYTRTARPESERTADYAANRRASFAERANPFSGLGDLFGLREQERVMRDMGVDRAEASKRLDAFKEMEEGEGMRRGGKVKRYASGGSVSSASKRADGIAVKGKTRGKFI